MKKNLDEQKAISAMLKENDLKGERARLVSRIAEIDAVIGSKVQNPKRQQRKA